MEYYTRNSDPKYYETHQGSSNCGSYAFNVKEWYDADGWFEDEVGSIDDWIIDKVEAGYDDVDISDFYAEELKTQILNDFDGALREVEGESDFIDLDEELVAFRTFCIYSEDGWTNYDFHFKVFRNGCWMEKCGGEEVRFCTIDDWSNGANTYISKIHYFAHKVS